MFFLLALTVLGPVAFAQVAPGHWAAALSGGWLGKTMAMTTLKSRLGAPGDRAAGRADAQTAKDRFVAAHEDWVSTVQQRQARVAQPLFCSHTLKRQGAAFASPY